MRRSIAGIVIALSLLRPVTAAAAPPQSVPNAVPYRVSAPVATGRDGTASVSSRALMSADGTTTIELATAPFGTEPQDAISTVLLKAIAPSGRILFTRVFNDTVWSGRVAWTFGDLVLGQAISLEAHVNDRILPRTDVATIDDVVRRRPDLRVIDVRVPAQTNPGVATVIRATIDEHNADIGARANCILSVDGQEVDRIDGLWVDAGDAVSCLFTHAFINDGAHAVRVAVADVDPGDWDTSNNALDRTVEVVGPFAQYYVQALERSEDDWFLKQAWYEYNGSPATGEDYRSERRLSQWLQGVHVQGTVTHRWSFPLTVDMSASDDTGVRFTTHTADLLPTNVSTGPNYDVACLSTRVGGSTTWVYVFACSRHDYAGDWSFIDFDQAQGRVDYLSLAYTRYWSGDSGNTTGYRYYNNTVIAEGSGSLVPFGPTLQVDFTVTAGDVVDGIDATLSMSEPATTHQDFPLLCGTNPISWGTFRFCNEAHNTTTVRGGLFSVGVP